MLRIPIEAGIAAGAPAWIEVDLGAVAHNVREFRRILPAGCQLFAVVKSNAYGHGMHRVAQTALAAGAYGLAVANVHEGEDLRAFGIEAPILVAGPMAPEDCITAVVHDLLPTLGNLEVAHSLMAHSSRPLAVHVEVDTGMRRNGVAAAELRSFLGQLRTRGTLQPTGVFTHFAAIDTDGVSGIQRQLATFTAALASVRDFVQPMRHAANTLAALLSPEAHLDAVRIGGGLYGFDPLRGNGPVHLLPALSLRARIVGLRDAAVGDAVGYGGTFVCTRPSRLALLPLGYADGLVRSHWQDAEVLVRDRRARIVGLVSMNQTIVDVTDVPDVQLGDEVTLLGAAGAQCVLAEQRVPPGGSTYEVTALLRATLPRRYLPAPSHLLGRDVHGRDVHGRDVHGRDVHARDLPGRAHGHTEPASDRSASDRAPADRTHGPRR